jgi:glycosyltransferase involved in cell wall biosynthesis
VKILYVSNLSPYPGDNGGRQRTKLLWEGLSRLGEIDFVLHSAWAIDPDIVQVLQERFNLVQYHMSPEPEGTAFFPLLAIYPRWAFAGAQKFASRSAFYAERKYVSGPIRELCEKGGYDLIACRYFRCASRSGLLDYTPLCIDVDDVDWEFFASAAASNEVGWLQRKIFLRQAGAMRELMWTKLRRANIAWISKPDDAQKIGPVTSHLLPNGVDAAVPPADRAMATSAQVMVFVGALGWRPNQLGLLQFAEQALPRVREHFPDAVLRVVGSNAPKDFVEKLKICPGIEYVGPVDDVAESYRNSAFAVVPVNSGAGSHIKILENFYHGVTCVTSRFGHRGYEKVFKTGESLLVGQSPEEMARACCTLLADPLRRAQMAQCGLDLVKREYTKESFYRRMAESIASLGIKPGQGGVARHSSALALA